MQQAYTGGHYLERSTPILGLCHGVFTERFIFRLSSSTQSVKVRKGNFATQDWTEAVQQNEESFSRSLNNASMSNWASILSNLGYFCEVRSIIVACGKIRDAYCRFDH